MIALVAAALMGLADPGSAPPAAPPPTLEEQLATARTNYAGAQSLYAESCGTRGYAAYDDICGQLQKQLHDYAVEVDRLTRKVEETREARARTRD